MEIIAGLFSIVVMIFVFCFALTVLRDVWGSGSTVTRRKR